LKLKNPEFATSGGVFVHLGSGVLLSCIVAVKGAQRAKLAKPDKGGHLHPDERFRKAAETRRQWGQLTGQARNQKREL
jgi:hypothetical protein